MALTADISLTFADAPADTNSGSYIIVNNTVLRQGSYVGIVSGSGLLSTISDTAGMEPVGFAQQGLTGDTGTAGNETRMDVKNGGGVGKSFAVLGVTGDGNVGESVFARDDNTFAVSGASTNIPAVGVVEAHITGTTCDVKFFSYAQMRGN